MQKKKNIILTMNENIYIVSLSTKGRVFVCCIIRVAIFKKSNIERHFRAVYTNFDRDYPIYPGIKRRTLFI